MEYNSDIKGEQREERESLDRSPMEIGFKLIRMRAEKP